MEEYKKLKEFELKEVKTYRTIFGIILAIFIVIPVTTIIGYSIWNFWNQEVRQDYSLLIK